MISWKERMANRIRLEIIYDTDTQAIASIMGLTGSSSEEVKEFKRVMLADRDAILDAKANCPEGRLAIWHEENL